MNNRFRRKLLASAFSILVIGAVLSPIGRNWEKKPRDSFPLSHYPMFSFKRNETQRVVHFVALDDAGNRHPVDYRLVGRGGLNQIRKQISKAVKRGEAEKLCAKIASRMARGNHPSQARLTRIQVSTGTYHLERYFTAGQKEPVSEKIHAVCPIDRSTTSRSEG